MVEFVTQQLETDVSSGHKSGQGLQLNALSGVSDVGALGNWMHPASTSRGVLSCLASLLYLFFS